MMKSDIRDTIYLFNSFITKYRVHEYYIALFYTIISINIIMFSFFHFLLLVFISSNKDIRVTFLCQRAINTQTMNNKDIRNKMFFLNSYITKYLAYEFFIAIFYTYISINILMYYFFLFSLLY